MSETIELIFPVLGMQPYVLIEMQLDDSPAGFKLDVQAGGGIRSADDIRSMLQLALDNFPDGD